MAKQKQKTDSPVTNFFSVLEKQVIEFWDKNKIFEKSVDKEAPQGDYVFYDGPPFGTGEPHYGHILSSVSKDVVPRYWTMRGYRVERRWGWDCHGLPIENIIEQDKGISGKKEIEKIGIDAFNEACRCRVLDYAGAWEIMVKRIARWIEFKNSYKTMSPEYMESVWWAFKELWQKDLIYQGRKVLLYCPRCETPISNFEVAMDNSYKEISETSVTAKFKLKEADEKLGIKGDVYILAWTTTPWTLPGNVALAVGEDIDYVAFKLSAHPEISDAAYIVSQADFEQNRGKQGKTEIIKKLKGKDLAGLNYVPLFDLPAYQNSGKKAYYVATADFVTTEDGTGVVHTAVVYGEDDYRLGLELDLPVIPVLDEKGYFTEIVAQLKGVYFKKADKLVIKYLEEKDLLFAKQDFTHSYPFCHRCDTQLFYNAIPAWFLNIDKIRPDLIEQNENINWYPKHLKHGRFKLGLEQAPDWNISRNRYFATPMPIWECGQCRKKDIIGSVEELKEKSGKGKIEDIHSHYIDDLTWPCDCGGTMHRIKEVFDCWFESGSMPFAQTHYPFENKDKFESNFPARFISEYISQTRAWFYVMHVMSVALFGKNSYENVVTTGVILNEKGEKMSKSKKNYPDPWKVIEEFGADALRFYLMSSTIMRAENLFFNERDLRDVFRKNIMLLWNVYKFYEMYADQFSGFNFQVSAPVSDNILDQWILARLNQLVKEATDNMNNYNLPKATRPIQEFIDDLSTWYIRRSRDRFKVISLRESPATNGAHANKDKKAALETTGYVLLQLSKVLAPFTPFIAEQIWQKVSGNNFKDENKSVHLEEWPKHGTRNMEHETKILKNMEMVRKIVEMGLAKRDEAGIKVRQPLSELRIKNYELEEEYTGLVLDELNIKNIVSEKGNGEIEVELDAEITPELKQEGMKREIVRLVNNLRKNAGMTIQDTAVIYWESESGEIKHVFDKYRNEIMNETLSSEINNQAKEAGESGKEVKVNGEAMNISLEKV